MSSGLILEKPEARIQKLEGPHGTSRQEECTSVSGVAVLECEGLKKSYRTGAAAREIVSGATFCLHAGEWAAIMGPSGVGKTTFLHVLCGILPPDAGIVRWRGEDLYAMGEGPRDHLRATSSGVIFQFHHLMPDLTVEENVRLSLKLAKKRDDAGRVTRLLDQLGLGPHRHSRIERLSGGERQRVAVARALAHEPSFLFADEPTGNLDEHATEELLDLLDSLRRSTSVSILMATHNPAVARRAAKTYVLTEGRVVQK